MHIGQTRLDKASAFPKRSSMTCHAKGRTSASAPGCDAARWCVCAAACNRTNRSNVRNAQSTRWPTATAELWGYRMTVLISSSTSSIVGSVTASAAQSASSSAAVAFRRQQHCGAHGKIGRGIISIVIRTHYRRRWAEPTDRASKRKRLVHAPVQSHPLMTGQAPALAPSTAAEFARESGSPKGKAQLGEALSYCAHASDGCACRHIGPAAASGERARPGTESSTSEQILHEYSTWQSSRPKRIGRSRGFAPEGFGRRAIPAAARAGARTRPSVATPVLHGWHNHPSAQHAQQCTAHLRLRAAQERDQRAALFLYFFRGARKLIDLTASDPCTLWTPSRRRSAEGRSVGVSIACARGQSSAGSRRAHALEQTCACTGLQNVHCARPPALLPASVCLRAAARDRPRASTADAHTR